MENKNLKIIEMNIEDLVDYENNPRKTKKIAMLEKSISRFGFINPVVAYHNEESNEAIILAGHQRVQAAKTKGIKTIPVIFPVFKNFEEARAYILADNRTAENGSAWDDEKLQAELQSLPDMEFLEFKEFSFVEQEQKIDEWDFTEIYEPFWIVIRGPITEMKKYKNTLLEMSKENEKIIVTCSHETSRDDGYIVGWEATRKEKLKMQPTCEICGSSEKLVIHHIIPLLDGGDLTNQNNLQTTCRKCHEKIHGRGNG